MEKGQYNFDVKFLKEQIIQSEKLINDKNTSLSEKSKLIELKQYFENITSNNYNQKARGSKKIKINKTLCEQLENKFNNDLEKLPIEYWHQMQVIRQNAEDFDFSQKHNNNHILLSNELVIELILALYKSLNDEYYKAALKIVQSPTSLINFDESFLAPNQCFYCFSLKAPFINVKDSEDISKYIRLIHELQHGIDWLTNDYKKYSMFSEVASIFFEIILTDLFLKITPCEELYDFRINNHIYIMEWINAYADALLLFQQNGNKVTKSNIGIILNANDKECLKYKCRKFGSKNFLSYYNYAISFLKALEIREKYYQVSKKDAVLELKNLVSGKIIDINFDNLLKSYNRYIQEIQEKQNTYQKTVK